METTSFLPLGYCHEGKVSLSSDLHRFQPIGLGFIFTSSNDGHFIGIEECSSVHKELDSSHIKRQTTVVAYFNRQKGGETFTRLLYGSLQALSNTSSDKAHSLEVHLQFFSISDFHWMYLRLQTNGAINRHAHFRLELHTQLRISISFLQLLSK